jgi:hypothetical protein
VITDNAYDVTDNSDSYDADDSDESYDVNINQSQ